MNPGRATSPTHGRSTSLTVPSISWRLAHRFVGRLFCDQRAIRRRDSLGGADGPRRDAARAPEVGIRRQAKSLFDQARKAPRLDSAGPDGYSIREERGVDTLDGQLEGSSEQRRGSGWDQ